MNQIDFSSLPILINGVWVASGLEGSAEIEIDETGEPYVDRITLEADGKGVKPALLKRAHLGRQPKENDVIFAMIEIAILIYYAAEVDDMAAQFHAKDCGYGHLQHERM